MSDLILNNTSDSIINSNDPLCCLSPLDGRYISKTKVLRSFFSEFSLMKYRIFIEIHYFLHLSIVLNFYPSLSTSDIPLLQSILTNFNLNDALRIKEIEKNTNHDVKAIEYFIKEKFNHPSNSYIHYGLTSQDINTSANMLQIKHTFTNIILPNISKIINTLQTNLITPHLNTPMLSRTHGQPASPTTLGKEFLVFVERLNDQIKIYNNIPWTTKFGGAIGNFNSLHLTHPNIDWIKFSNDFITEIGLIRSQYTTQIDHYDNLAARFDTLKRINNILINLSQDIWSYISQDYFHLTIIKDEVGSSTMPHKINPIDFENAEGNLLLSNAILEFLSRKLPISRLQRDLTDSTIIRNIGTAFGHTLIAMLSLITGLNKLTVNHQKLNLDLTNNWLVITEGIQLILKREGIANSYELIKDLTRRHDVTLNDLHNFISQLPNISNNIKEELIALTPQSYLGIFPKL